MAKFNILIIYCLVSLSFPSFAQSDSLSYYKKDRGEMIQSTMDCLSEKTGGSMELFAIYSQDQIDSFLIACLIEVGYDSLAVANFKNSLDDGALASNSRVSGGLIETLEKAQKSDALSRYGQKYMSHFVAYLNVMEMQGGLDFHKIQEYCQKQIKKVENDPNLTEDDKWLLNDVTFKRFVHFGNLMEKPGDSPNE